MKPTKRWGLVGMLCALNIGGVLESHAGWQANAGQPGGRESKSGAGAQTVTLKTADGWNIVGDLYAPAGKSQGAVVLLHQRGGQGSAWGALCRALQTAHITALAIDQRGAGRSAAKKGQNRIGEKEEVVPTDGAPWLTTGDIAAAVVYLKDKGPAGLAGASYGANNALIYAAAHAGQVKAVALFSPGVNYHGLDAMTAARQFKGSVLIFHDKNDAIAGSGPGKINAALPTRDHTLRLSNGSEHGTALLTDATIRDTVTFFQRVLK